MYLVAYSSEEMCEKQRNQRIKNNSVYVVGRQHGLGELFDQLWEELRIENNLINTPKASH